VRIVPEDIVLGEPETFGPEPTEPGQQRLQPVDIARHHVRSRNVPDDIGIEE
jgi:hypothetical protein